MSLQVCVERIFLPFIILLSELQLFRAEQKNKNRYQIRDYMFMPSVKKNENNKNERKPLLTAAMTNRLSTVVKKVEKRT